MASFDIRHHTVLGSPSVLMVRGLTHGRLQSCLQVRRTGRVPAIKSDRRPSPVGLKGENIKVEDSVRVLKFMHHSWKCFSGDRIHRLITRTNFFC